MLANSSAKGAMLASLAVAGLLAGIAACSGSPNEVVVQPPPPANTAGTEEVAEADPPEDEAQPEAASPRPRKPRARVAATQAGASNCCKGKNECKGKGNCKTDQHDCKGRNDCKGTGGCKGFDCDSDVGQGAAGAPVKAPPPPISVPGAAGSGGKMCCRALNDCKGKGGCKTLNNECKGQNDCKGQGGCKLGAC